MPSIRSICRKGTRTTDEAIIAMCMREGRIVVSKDADFVSSLVLRHEPERLLLISTGNIGNARLEDLLMSNLPLITTAFEVAMFVELSRGQVVVHE